MFHATGDSPPPSVPSCQNLHFYASAVLGASGPRCCFIFLFTARTLKSPKMHSAQHPTNQLGQWPGASGSPSSSVLGSPTTMATLLFLGALGVVKVEVVQPGKKYDTMGKTKSSEKHLFEKGRMAIATNGWTYLDGFAPKELANRQVFKNHL